MNTQSRKTGITTLAIWLLCVLGIPAIGSAADFSGTWVAVAMREGRSVATSFTFKIDSGALTGTVRNQEGSEVAISDGKVSDDDISFSVVRGSGEDSVKFDYTGTMSGDEIHFKLRRGTTELPAFTAKRQGK